MNTGYYLKLFIEEKCLIRLEPLAQIKPDPDWDKKMKVPTLVREAISDTTIEEQIAKSVAKSCEKPREADHSGRSGDRDRVRDRVDARQRPKSRKFSWDR